MADQRLGTQFDVSNHPRTVCSVLDIPIHDVTLEETLDWIGHWIKEGGTYQVATVNPEFLMQARNDATFRATLKGAALCVPDGYGVLWAARWHHIRIRERVAGSDLVPRLSERAAQQGWRVFYLGAAPGIAEQAASILATRHPGLTIAGCYAGSPAPEEADAICARVRESEADILLVAYGAPKQDVWLSHYLTQTGATVGIGVGGSFDFVAGVRKRAPRWIQRIGLEWLHRLLSEPWRWRRQLVLPHFAWLTLSQRDSVKMIKH